MNTLSSILKFIEGYIAPFATDQTANEVLASPNGSSGKPTFRALDAADIPNIPASKVTSGSMSADRIGSGTLDSARLPTVPINKGGSGQTAISTPSISISTSSGTRVSHYARQWGKIVSLMISVKNSSAVESGDDIWAGTMTTTAYRPAVSMRGCSFYGTRPIIGYVNTDGAMAIRNCGANTLAANTEVNIALTYIIP